MTVRNVGDKVPSKINSRLTALGGAVYSTCVSLSYPRNGNVHNPTPRILWVATLGGKPVSRAYRKREVVEGLEKTILEGEG